MADAARQQDEKEWWQLETAPPPAPAGYDGAMTPEIARLEAYKRQHGVVGEHVSWGVIGRYLSDEQKAATINRMLESVAADMAETVTAPLSVIVDMYEALLRTAALGQADVANWFEMSDGERALRLQIRNLTGSAMLRSDACLPRRLRDEIKAKIRRSATGAVD